MINETIYRIWDTYDCDGDDKLSQEEAKAFIKDSLCVLMLKAKKEIDGEIVDDCSLDLEEAKESLEEDYWRLFTLFDPEYLAQPANEHDQEYAGYITKDDMLHFLRFLLGEEPINSEKSIDAEEDK